MWSERSGITNAVIVGAFLAALAGLSVLAWAVASPGPDDESPVIEAIRNDHLVYLLGPNEITVVDPETRETVHTIATEYDPEVAIAPDGATIYLTDGLPGNEMLSVIDTRSWQIVDQLASPDRIDNIGVGTDGMAISADGRYVYVHKWQFGEGQFTTTTGSEPNADHWWDVYDTTTQGFTDNSPHVPNCSGPVFPPLNGSSSLAILCYQTETLIFADLPSGEITASIRASDSSSADMCDRSDRELASAAQAPDGTIYLVTVGGCVRLIDPTEMAVTETFKLDIPPGWRVPYRMVTLSPSGDRLALAVGPGVFNGSSREAWVIEVASRSILSTIPLPLDEPSTWSLAVSPDDSMLYVVRYESSLSAIDIATGTEVWRMTDVNAPWVVRVAPRP